MAKIMELRIPLKIEICTDYYKQRQAATSSKSIRYVTQIQLYYRASFLREGKKPYGLVLYYVYKGEINLYS